MIALDSSAAMAIVLNEPDAASCRRAIALADKVLISAGTLAETLIVASGRGALAGIEKLISSMPIEIVSVDATMAARVADSYRIWGKGNHPARLNMGDCFSYALAKDRDCPLLYVGNDFLQTDIRSAL